jgi:glycosyltransferase involved in cell wall biosynthesis
MKILVISHKPPYPVVDGGCLAMTRFLENLHSIYPNPEITYFSLSTHKHPFDLNKFPTKKFQNTKFNNHFINTRLNPFSALTNLLSGKSYNLSRFYDKIVSVELTELCIHNKFDVIIFDSLFSCVYLDDIKACSNTKFVYRAHNIESQIWKDLSQATKNPIKKWYLLQLQKKLEKFEDNFLKTVDLILPLSNKDLEVIKSKTDKETILIPVSIEIPEKQANYSKTSLCFIGAFNWKPNIEAIQWFSTTVFPTLKKEFPTLELHIAGSHSENISKLKEIKGITLHGFVNSSVDFISQHGIFIAPLKSGSGVKMKVLEAMSIGIPCSLSLKGAEGIPGNFVLNENVNDFISDIKALLSDEKLRIKRGIEGQQIVKSKFGNETVIRILSERFDIIEASENILNIAIQ